VCRCRDPGEAARDTQYAVRRTDVGQMGRGVDGGLAISRSGEQGVRGMALPLPCRGVERRSAFLAGFEIPAPEVPPAPVLVRSARAEFPVRWWIHERTRMVPPHRRPAPPGARLHRRRPPRPRRVRPAGGLPPARPRDLVRLPAPGSAALPGHGPLPAGRRPAGGEVPRGGRAPPGRKALYVERRRAREGDDRGEPCRRPAQILRQVPPGGEAGGGGDPAGGGGAGEDGRHRRPGQFNG
jgi:hypothetical protein